MDAIDAPADGAIIDLPLDLIKNDRGTQVRTPDPVVYMDYRERILAGDVFPEIDVFWDGADFIQADGFHRFYGHREAKCKTIRAKIHHGTTDDALWFAAQANQKHGKRRSNADKRETVTALLMNKKFGKLSDRSLADHAGVDHKTVASVRAELQATGDFPQLTERVGRDGKARRAAQKREPVTDHVAVALAKEYDTTPEEIIRCGKFSEAVDLLTKTLGRDARWRILAGRSGLTQAEIIELANMPDADQRSRWASQPADEVTIGLAKLANVTPAQIDQAHVVRMSGETKIINAVERGEMELDEAVSKIGHCRRGGNHEWTEEDGESFCSKCKHPRDAAPDHVAITPAEPKHVSDLLLATTKDLHKLVAKWPAELRKVLGQRLVSAGEEIIARGDLA